MGRIRKAGFAAFLLAFFCVSFGFLAIYQAYNRLSYLEVDGFIAEVEEKESFSIKEKKTEYEYNIHYFYNGEERIYHKERVSSKPDESISKVYCSKDGDTVSLENSEDTIKDARFLFIISGLLYLLGYLLYKMTGKIGPYSFNKNWTDLKATGIIGMMASSGGLFIMLQYLIRCLKISKASVDVIIILCFMLTVSIINFRTGSKIEKNVKMQQNNMTSPYNYNRYRAG